MAIKDDQPPIALDIKAQLEKMLASNRFVRSPRHSELLDLIVSMCLKGKQAECTEAFIRHKLFPNRDPKDQDNDAIVRTTANELRKRLDLYYANEGRSDPVKVEVPTGRYIATFAWAGLSEPERLCRQALILLEADFIENAGRAKHVLSRVINKFPEFGCGYAYTAELLLKSFSCNIEDGFAFPKTTWANLTWCISKAESLAPSFWLTHLVAGAFYSCEFNWKKAEAAFSRALKLDPRETQRHWWYAAFLLVNGKKDKALSLVTAMANQFREHVPAQLIKALFLYVTRQYNQAEDALRDVLLTNASCLGEVLFACVKLANQPVHRSDVRRLEGILKPNYANDNSGEPNLANRYLGLLILLYRHASQWFFKDLANFKESSEWIKERKIFYREYPSGDFFAASDSGNWGVTIGGIDPYEDCDAHGASETNAGSESSPRRRQEFYDPSFDPVQRSLACMATGQTLRNKQDDRDLTAVEFLSVACDDHNPLMAWLHLWPIFDPLRDDPEFQKLLERQRPQKAI